MQLSAVWRMEAFGPASGSEQYSDELSDEQMAKGGPQDTAAQAEDRAARLAMRRHARDVPLPRSQPAARARVGMNTQRKAQQAQPATGRAAAASIILNQGGNARGPAGRGEPSG